MRGARRLVHVDNRLGGIIPACAGSTWLFGLLCGWIRDHPRMCGEHFSCLSIFDISLGSSPHVRGARVHAPDRENDGGIIPACAGSTDCPKRHGACSRDHPRMCGEHNIVFVPYNLYRGSSPHVRGAPGARHYVWHYAGIIPACAGSTSTGIRFRSCSGDHPRMCGEHALFRQLVHLEAGSSPHVRGAQYAGASGAATPGIIPACAGSTLRK